jgi:hypothetical protein
MHLRLIKYYFKLIFFLILFNKKIIIVLQTLKIKLIACKQLEVEATVEVAV